MEKEKTTKSMKIWIQDEIIMIKILIKGEYTMDYLTENIIVCREFLERTKIEKKLLFVDPGESSKLSLEARKRLSAEFLKYLDKMAILAKNPVANVIASFFLRLNKMPLPAKIFNDKNKAIKWLKEN